MPGAAEKLTRLYLGVFQTINSSSEKYPSSMEVGQTTYVPVAVTQGSAITHVFSRKYRFYLSIKNPELLLWENLDDPSQNDPDWKSKACPSIRDFCSGHRGLRRGQNPLCRGQRGGRSHRVNSYGTELHSLAVNLVLAERQGLVFRESSGPHTPSLTRWAHLCSDSTAW